LYDKHNGEKAIGIWTIKKVKKGEKLSYTYDTKPFVGNKNYPTQKCLCLGKNMSGRTICQTDL
jgi:hypothetical protein